MSCLDPVITQDIRELTIDTLESLPDFLIAERDYDTTSEFVRVPTSKLIPSVADANVFALEPNNEAITIPEHQVRACRTVNEGSTITMQYADTTHAPMYLALGELSGMILCQSTGVITLANHEYIIGTQYYVGDNGEPTTTVSDYKLFIPLSATKLLVTL